MSNKFELIVPFDKEKFKNGLIVIPFVMLGTVFCYFSLKAWLGSLLGYYPLLLVRYFFICFDILLLIGFIYSIILLQSKSPVAILNEDGIKVKYFGFIPWKEISEFDIYIVPTTPVESIGVRVKDITILSRQATFNGKCVLFWSKLFGYPPIILSNLALENDYVICFARQFLNN